MITETRQAPPTSQAATLVAWTVLLHSLAPKVFVLDAAMAPERKQGRSRAGTNYLTVQEEKTLFNCLKGTKGKQAERDYVLLKLCRSTGLRRGEVLALDVGDVMGKDKIIVDERIAEKGAVGEVYLPVELQDILKHFLRLKRQWREGLEDDSPLFISKKGGRLSLRSFNDLMDYWTTRSGIPRYTPHALRHTKGQRIMNDRKHLDDTERHKALLLAQRQLRHKSINSTVVYTGPTKEEMQRVGEI